MADIRIKDITTTASSTASGDFFVIDGTTGTRKVNAFNPTFGGNATVTGTLTVNGASTLTGATTIGGDSSNGNYLSYNSDISGFCGLWMRQSSKSATNYVLASNGTSGTLVNATGASLFLRIENTTALEINTSRNVLIPTTTASTTTSTGALVVGNGTSGGLGVGGAIFAGDSVTIPNAKNFVVRNAAGSSTGIRMYADSSDYGYIDCTANTELRLQVGAGTKLSITNTGNVSIPATTASTTTSSGALVVSGGVGVAGAINCGSGLVANPLFTQTRKLEAQIPHTVSTEDYLRIGSNTGSTNTYAGEFGYGLTAGGSPQIRFNRVHAGTVTTWLTVPTSTGDAEFAGSVKTAAPSGGTAANWKLGTVATVSPTSPNRTIEVDIGGTIYYIHAKTTNN
jgi:hypothetical protein